VSTIIRRATLHDIDSCIELAKIPEFTTLNSISDKAKRKYLKEFIEKEIFLVADDNGDIVGFMGGEKMLFSFLWIDVIVVRKDLRGKGIGSKLFSSMKKEAKKEGVKHVYLIAPQWKPKTIAFYEKQGMKKGRNFVEFSMDL
jgi:N-acetylglutamate synthase-like GNAT family acetyltransferase